MRINKTSFQQNSISTIAIIIAYIGLSIGVTCKCNLGIRNSNVYTCNIYIPNVDTPIKEIKVMSLFLNLWTVFFANRITHELPQMPIIKRYKVILKLCIFIKGASDCIKLIGVW